MDGEDDVAEDETTEAEAILARGVLMVHGEACRAGFRCN
jgi:hypothetical protein